MAGPRQQGTFFNPSGKDAFSNKYTSPFAGSVKNRGAAVSDLAGLSPEQIDVAVNQRLDAEKRKLDAEIQKSQAALANLEGPQGNPKQAAKLRAHLAGLLDRRTKIDQEAEIIRTQAKQPYEARRARETRETQEAAGLVTGMAEDLKYNADRTAFDAGQRDLRGAADALGRDAQTMRDVVGVARADQDIFRDQALGLGPSAAQGVLRQGTDEAIRSGMALASTGRGANQAAALRAGGLKAQELSGQAATQASILAAQEQQQGMQNLLQSQNVIQQGVAAAAQIQGNQAQVISQIVQNEQEWQAFEASLDQNAKSLALNIWAQDLQRQLAEKGIQVDLSQLDLAFQQFDFQKSQAALNNIMGFAEIASAGGVGAVKAAKM